MDAEGEVEKGVAGEGRKRKLCSNREGAVCAGSVEITIERERGEVVVVILAISAILVCFCLCVRVFFCLPFLSLSFLLEGRFQKPG